MSFRRYWRRAGWDRDRLDEIEAHVAIETDENIARGMSPREAGEAARRKFGSIPRVREEIYRMNTIGFIDTLVRDINHGLRALRHNPAFTVAALLTLAIGIGANTAVFSVVNSVLLRPLNYPKPEELVAVWHTAPGAPGLASVSGDLRLSASMYFTYAAENRTFRALGLWSDSTTTVTGLAEPEQVRTVFLTDGTLGAFNVPPSLGRWLSQADQVPGGPQNVMLGYGYWQRRFGGDRSVIGRSIRVESRPRQIVGVMPAGFRVVGVDPELILPLAFDRAGVGLPGFGYHCVARLRPGATLAEANADLARMVPIWMSSWPAAPGINPKIYESWRIGPAVRPLKQDVVGNTSSVLWVVMGTVVIVMLIACANVANLQLVRAEARRQELAIRAALGAGWMRIVRELLLESMLIALMGGVLGTGMAYAGLRLLVASPGTGGPANLPRLAEISIDARALGFTFGVALFSGLLFGLMPALKFARTNLSVLRGAGRGLSQSRERHRARNVLAVVQIALALVLLVSSGLMIRTFQSLRKVDPGFTEPAELQTVRISIPKSLVEEPERAARMQNDIVNRLAGLSGVTSVAFASAMPMEGIPPDFDAIVAEGQNYPDSTIPPMRFFKSVSPGLFRTTGTRLIAGRDYTWAELSGRRPLAIVSENLARELWGSAQAAVGKRLRAIVPAAPWREVIGVVQDVRENGVDAPAPAMVYWPALRESLYQAGTVYVERTVTLAIRSRRAGTESFLNEMRQAVWQVNASLPLASVRTMREVYDKSLARTSFTLTMMAIAGAMALALGLIGIYGVISYAVAQRRREIGIRVALGAQQGELRGMFVRQGLMLAGAGVGIGLVAASGLTRAMTSLLYGVSPLDPVTYALVPMVLVAAVVVASYVPARRASAVDPVEALRAE